MRPAATFALFAFNQEQYVRAAIEGATDGVTRNDGTLVWQDMAAVNSDITVAFYDQAANGATGADDGLGIDNFSITPQAAVATQIVQDPVAAEHDIDLEKVEGTGRRGRVTKKDVLAFIEQWPAPKTELIALPS